MADYFRWEKDGRKKPEQAKALEFLAKAVSTDETRNFMMNISVEGDRLVSTDGRRMHIVHMETGLDDGVYKIDVCRSAIVLTMVQPPRVEFPNVERIVKQYTGMPKVCGLDLHGGSLFGRNGRDLGIMFHKIGRGFDLAYMRDLLGFTWEVQHRGEKSGAWFSAQLYLKNIQVDAIIMGLSNDDD